MTGDEFAIRCADGSEPLRLEQGEEFVVVLPASPNDGRCVAGWGHPAERCANRAETEYLLCAECAPHFARRTA